VCLLPTGRCPDRRGDTQILLPRTTRRGRQLQDVPGGGGEEPQASGRLRHASDEGLAHQDQLRSDPQGTRGRHGVPADEPSPRLPHLRPERLCPYRAAYGVLLALLLRCRC